MTLMTLKHRANAYRKAISESEEALQIALEKPKYAPKPEEFEPLAQVEGILAAAKDEADLQHRIELMRQTIADKKLELETLEAQYAAEIEATAPARKLLIEKAGALQAAQAKVLRLATEIYQIGTELNGKLSKLDGSRGYLDAIELNPPVFNAQVLEGDKVMLRFCALREAKELHESGAGLLARIPSGVSQFQ